MILERGPDCERGGICPRYTLPQAAMWEGTNDILDFLAEDWFEAGGTIDEDLFFRFYDARCQVDERPAVDRQTFFETLRVVGLKRAGGRVSGISFSKTGETMLVYALMNREDDDSSGLL